MIATRRARSHATTRAVHPRPPLYVPPALCGDGETPHESRQRTPWSQDVRRDPPPHKDPLQSPLRRLDSPNWRTPGPNRPATFRSPPAPPQSPAPPANSPPASPTCPFHPKTPPTTQQHHFKSQLGTELIALIKTTSEALQSIAQVAEGLICWVNAERRLAHKLQRTTWSSHEDTRGNAVCLQPPVFPSGRVVPVTGSLGDSDPLA